jgi:predicted aspartyl protease
MLANLLAASVMGTAVQAPVEVPFRRTEHALFVDAKVNGRPLSLMFDTGFSGAIDADEGINIGEPDGNMKLRDFLGQMDAQTVKIASLKLGDKDIDCDGLDAVQTPANQFTFIYGTHCDGLMGLEAIRRSVTEICFEKSKFIFYPRSVDISKRVPDNKRTFLVKMLPKGEGEIVLQATTASGQPLTMALDTGNSFFATTYKEALERVGLWDGREAKYGNLAGIASGAAESWEVKMPALTVFGVPVTSSVWDVLDRPSSEANSDGTIGYQFLKNFNITIDYDRRYVWLENYNGVTGNEAVGETGISAMYSASHKAVVIMRISPGSPADVAGIKEGDQILAVDGLDMSRQNLRQMREVLEGGVGSKLKIAISHAGALKRYELERKPLVNLATGASL